jgi:hypothetical protein
MTKTPRDNKYAFEVPLLDTHDDEAHNTERNGLIQEHTRGNSSGAGPTRIVGGPARSYR